MKDIVDLSILTQFIALNINLHIINNRDTNFKVNYTC